MTTERTTWTVGRRHVSWRRVLLGVGVLSGGLLLGGLVPGMVHAGTLDPPAGAVDGGGDPASTGGTYPAWDKILPANDGVDSCNSSRFTCVMPTAANQDGEAVRDNETGLTWERSPSITGGPNSNGTRPWVSAISHCANRTVGGRKGWELPMRNQLASLVDPSVASLGPTLPPGHPFSNVQSRNYWSATTFADNPTLAWGVLFANGNVSLLVKGNGDFFVWCVRGGQSFDGNTHSTLH